jgi:Tfp pilus assembly ATPase PilU
MVNTTIMPMESYRSRDGTTSKIHVTTANLGGIVAEMVQQTLQQQSDIQLIGGITRWESIDAAIPQTDVLVLGVENVYSLPEACFRFLSQYPNLKILLLTTTDEDAIAYWRALHCQQIQVSSSQSLIESIRQIYARAPF